MKYNKNIKPDVNKCPKEFCFNWDEGNGKCGEDMPTCYRAVQNKINEDYYEPCNPELKKHDLPWFYFIPNAEMLDEEDKEEYLRESTRLWGKQEIYNNLELLEDKYPNEVEIFEQIKRYLTLVTN